MSLSLLLKKREQQVSHVTLSDYYTPTSPALCLPDVWGGGGRRGGGIVPDVNCEEMYEKSWTQKHAVTVVQLYLTSPNSTQFLILCTA